MVELTFSGLRKPIFVAIIDPPHRNCPHPPPGDNQPSQSPHDYADGPRSQSSGQGSSSDSGKKDGADSSKAEDSNDADRGKDETRAQEVLPDFEEAEENRIDPADIKFYLAAQHNPVTE